MMNDGLGSDTFAEIDSAEVRNKPFLSEHTSFAASFEGNSYIVYLVAHNVAGSTASESIGFVLASQPEAPESGP